MPQFLPILEYFGTVFRRRVANHAQGVFLLGETGAPLALTPAVAASQSLTSDNTNVANNSTITVNGRVYTNKTALTVPAAVDEILIGADADGSLLNFSRALNHVGTEGTDYSLGTLQNSDVSASASVTAHAITLTSRKAGAVGNLIDVATSSAHLTFGAAVLAGGRDSVLATGGPAVGGAAVGGITEVDTFPTSAVTTATTNVGVGALWITVIPLTGFIGTINGMAWLDAATADIPGGTFSRTAMPGNVLGAYTITRSAGKYSVLQGRPT